MNSSLIRILLPNQEYTEPYIPANENYGLLRKTGGAGVRLAILVQILLPRFCNARLTLDGWHPKKLATADA